MKKTIASIAITFGVTAICWLGGWFLLSAANAALTPAQYEIYRRHDCPAGIQCTNIQHLYWLRRTNSTSTGTSGGSVGVRG